MLLRYLSGIVTSMFKADLDGCGGHDSWEPSGFGDSRAGVFPVIFVLNSNDLP